MSEVLPPATSSDDDEGFNDEDSAYESEVSVVSHKKTPASRRTPKTPQGGKKSRSRMLETAGGGATDTPKTPVSIADASHDDSDSSTESRQTPDSRSTASSRKTPSKNLAQSTLNLKRAMAQVQTEPHGRASPGTARCSPGGKQASKPRASTPAKRGKLQFCVTPI